jgi:ATP-binding cassette subfamily B (MDR/TAP) protein 9
VFYGGLMVRNEDITSGQLVSFLLYLQSLSDAIASMGWVFGSLTQAVGAADKVFELLNRQPKVTPPSTARPIIEAERHSRAHNLQLGTFKTTNQRLQGIVPESARGQIEFKDVTLYYPSRPQKRVLNGISFKVEPGSIVALVGESGGGKSSIISLLLHHYEQQSGRILFDGIAIHELQAAWLCRNVSIVSQEPTLFGRSIKRNIMYGLEGTSAEPNQEEIEEAARLANADSFIQNMPMKYDTEVGERGVQLSGGQKQRIAIARALVRKPRVLLCKYRLD